MLRLQASSCIFENGGDLVGVEAFFPVVSAIGYVAFHAANSIFQRIEFRFELSQPNLAGTISRSIEYDVSRATVWYLGGFAFQNQSENKVYQSSWEKQCDSECYDETQADPE